MTFTEKITFPVGILVGGAIFTEAILEEELFGHTLRASSMVGLDTQRLDEEAYFSAAKLAVRLTVPGLFEARMEHDPEFRELIEEYAEVWDLKAKQVTAAKIHPVSPELVESLHRADGRLLLAKSAMLEERRAEFRAKALAVPHGSPGAAKAGVQRSGDPEEKPGRGEGDT